MPRFVDDRETVDVQAPWWGEKEFCTIKRFNYGDRQHLAGQSIAMGINPEDEGSAVADVLIDRMNLAILERGIVRWTDESGESIPVTRTKIERLEEKDAEFILHEIQTLNPRKRRSPEAQESFRDGSGDSNTE
jgi:hypothetical protein